MSLAQWSELLIVKGSMCKFLKSLPVWGKCLFFSLFPRRQSGLQLVPIALFIGSLSSELKLKQFLFACVSWQWHVRKSRYWVVSCLLSFVCSVDKSWASVFCAFGLVHFVSSKLKHTQNTVLLNCQQGL